MARTTGLPAFTAGMRIGLFGGSFDPPHAGHLEVSLVALKHLRLDRVWWLVSPQNPLKPHAPSSDVERRIAAARTLAAHPRIEVTGIEAELGTRYTAETLDRLLPRLAGANPVWMMGADNLANFHRWGRWRSIVGRLPLAVFNRPGNMFPALASPAATTMAGRRIRPRDAALLANIVPPAWVFLPSPYIPLSSTQLRQSRARDAVMS